MSEQLIDLLKLGLLALLYLFFLRVIWAVWTELRSPAAEPRLAPAGARGPSPAPKRAKSRSGRGRSGIRALTVVEPPELRGTEHPLAGEMTLGRAPGCTVVVDDTYVSQLHARVFADTDGHKIEDLGSTNGTYHNGSPVSAPRLLSAGDRIQIGNVVLEAT